MSYSSLDLRRAAPVLVLVLGLAGACGGPSISFINPTCPPQQCGSNSPELLGHRISPLSTDGTPNDEGLQLVPGSLTGGGCGAGPLTLRVQAGELYGQDPDGARACSGAALLGATFLVQKQADERGELAGSPAKAGLVERFRIRIARRNDIETWELDPALRQVVPAYEFLVEPSNRPGDRELYALCQPLPWMEQWQLENLPPVTSFPRPSEPRAPSGRAGANPPVIRGRLWGEPSTFAVVVQGEGYDGVGSVSEEGADWINIGCAGRAVAKLRLLGFDPMCTAGRAGSEATCGQRLARAEQRQATLKMITARYRDREVHTKQGTSLLWFRSDGVQYFGDPALDSSRVGPIEAMWTSTGATCLSHLRTSQPVDGTEQRVKEMNQEESKGARGIRGEDLGECQALTPRTLQRSLAEVFLPGIWWVTFTYDHVPHSPPRPEALTHGD